MAEGKPGLQTVTYKSIIARDGPGVCRLQAPWDAEKAVSDRHNTRSVSAGQRAGEGWTQVPAPAGAQQTVTDKVLFSGSTQGALLGFGYCVCYSNCCLYLGVKVDDRPEREEQACRLAVLCGFSDIRTPATACSPRCWVTPWLPHALAFLGVEKGEGEEAAREKGWELVLSLLQASSHFLAEVSGCLHGQASVEPQARRSLPRTRTELLPLPAHRATAKAFRASLPGFGSQCGLGYLFRAGFLCKQL